MYLHTRVGPDDFLQLALLETEPRHGLRVGAQQPAQAHLEVHVRVQEPATRVRVGVVLGWCWVGIGVGVGLVLIVGWGESGVR